VPAEDEAIALLKSIQRATDLSGSHADAAY
jgi:hypothetical protein